MSVPGWRELNREHWDELVAIHVDGEFHDVLGFLAGRAGVEVEFAQTDVYEAFHALGGMTFDIVYGGIGAVHWVSDIELWEETMARLLAPGGRFYMAEFHPFATVATMGKPGRSTTDFRLDSIAMRSRSQEASRDPCPLIAIVPLSRVRLLLAAGAVPLEVYGSVSVRWLLRCAKDAGDGFGAGG